MFLFFVYYHRPLQYCVCFDIIINIFIEKLISCNKIWSKEWNECINYYFYTQRTHAEFYNTISQPQANNSRVFLMFQ